MRSYAADVWSMFGVDALRIWDIEFNEFLGMTREIDVARAEAEKSK